MNRLSIILPLLLAACLASPATAAETKTLTGKVIRVADGDTLTILAADKTQERIRFAGIDAPEKKQAYSAKSKAAVVKAAKGKQVRILWRERDKYGRILGHIYVDDLWLNHSQVEQGLAWHFKKYSKNKRLAAAEVLARKKKRGLWAESAEPMPPWEFRRLPKRSSPGLSITKGPAVPNSVKASTELMHWLNTSSNVRHNAGCRWYGKTKLGHKCGEDEGKACGICGG